ncbi:MAG: 50S ribosomal protein L5 [Candidatus Micrarchaeota archaeon]|nr:MAG: 50S ribosomal protein L5 [Candidatus Micrarchaeota archaeon]
MNNNIIIEKLVINIGTGNEEKNNEKAVRLLEKLTQQKPAIGLSRKRIQNFGISKKQKISAYVTIRGKRINDLIKRLLAVVDNKLDPRKISNNTISFGIREYIDIPGMKYDPSIGMYGMNVNIVFSRKGVRVERRRINRRKLPKSYKIIPKEEIMQYMSENFNTKFIK